MDKNVGRKFEMYSRRTDDGLNDIRSHNPWRKLFEIGLYGKIFRRDPDFLAWNEGWISDASAVRKHFILGICAVKCGSGQVPNPAALFEVSSDRWDGGI